MCCRGCKFKGKIFMNRLNGIERLFWNAESIVKQNYLMILFFVLLTVLCAIALTKLVNKMNCFNTATNNNIKPKGKKLVLFGIWLMPFAVFLIVINFYIMRRYGGGITYNLLAVISILCIGVILFFILLGVRPVFRKRKKACKSNIEKIKKEDITSISD